LKMRSYPLTLLFTGKWSRHKKNRPFPLKEMAQNKLQIKVI
jgi:hypothetical protein